MRPPERVRAPELMDAPEVDAAELERSLDDLERVNRWLGGSRVVLEALAPLLRRIDGEDVRVLDVGTGSADIPIVLARRARKVGVAMRIVATDAHPSTVVVARRRAAGERTITVEQADALALPYPDGAFHFAMCHTAMHHFDPPEAVRVLAELGRVSTRAVLVTDLVRSWTGVAGVRLMAATIWRRHPVTRHDGPVSLRAAYTPAELSEMAQQAGLGRHYIRTHFFFNRMALVAEPRPRAVS
ncbi:MAG: methyltransferase domain-containing protein [Gemmatimonadetes bacterium]|nr:methyltransferase domain-containing protein [Gemmatimonadota bacterium]